MKNMLKSEFFVSRWRPTMAYVYMITLLFDFILAPIGWSILQTMNDQSITQWSPLTLQGGAFYHLAMLAVLGITSWTRGQEKIARIKNGLTSSGNTHFLSE